MENKQNLKESFNKVTLIGKLVSKDIKQGVVKQGDRQGQNYITAKFVIRVADNSDIQVESFAFEKTNSGDTSKIYSNLLTVEEDYKSIEKDGEENADVVAVKNGKYAINDYVGQDGMTKSFPKFSTSFITRDAKIEESQAEFDVELAIQTIKEELDKEGEATGRVLLNGFIVNYNGSVAPITLVTPKDDEDGIAEFITDNFNAGDSVRLNGDIVYATVVKENTVGGSSFGRKTTTTIQERELVIRGGGGDAIVDDEGEPKFDLKLMKKAISDRQVYLNGLLEYSSSLKSSGGKKEEKVFGKGTTKPKAKAVEIDEEDLPF
jgi:hypothetical protein